jgi:hypothetical protein
MESITLHARGIAFQFVLPVVLLGTFLFMLIELGRPFVHHPTAIEALLLVMLAFLCAMMGMLIFMGIPHTLILSDEGFTVRCLASQRTVRWEDATNFRIASLNPNGGIKLPRLFWSKGDPATHAVVRSTFGVSTDQCIPPYWGSYTVEGVAELMREYARRARRG